jgi:hypothetical protein
MMAVALPDADPPPAAALLVLLGGIGAGLARALVCAAASTWCVDENA